MRVAVGYVPIESDAGVPLLSQNRQFQWFSRPTYVYPMVPASAATLLASRGHDVLWIDGIAEGLSRQRFEERFTAFSPDLFLLETKTPVVKATWRAVDRIKEIAPACRVVLCGDHPTAMPEESLANCRADFVLAGGDYDFSVAELADSLVRGAPPPPGFFWRGESGAVETSGPFDNRRHKLSDLPAIDRELTKWRLYSRANGNFRRLPGTYVMAARDCWWGKCSFCSWTTLYPEWRFRKPAQMLDEIATLVDTLGVKEIFDDSGCFPSGAWLREFCEGMVERGLSRRVTLGCNMIPGALDAAQYALMAKAGFKFVLFGLESANHGTLERINKCPLAKNVAESMRLAHEAGLRPHVTCMIGYPWETEADARATIALARSLFDKGWIDTLQATIVIPYPGTPLFRQCRENGWLRTEDWDLYDMRGPVMKCPIPDDRLRALVRGLYGSFLTPRFVWRQLRSIRTRSDAAFLCRAALRVAGHLFDVRAR